MSEKRLIGTPHLNNGLFADYYLNEIIPASSEWRDGELFASAKAVFQRLRDLRGRTDPAALDEAQLEEQWVKPVLGALNLHYSVQVKIRYRDKGHRKPDYVFVGSDEEARALTNEIYAPEQIAHALAVGDAKRWGVNLDQSAVNQRNPAQQIDQYLRYSELPWGILTDGRYWRLYHRDTSKYNSYYAVDLDHLLENDDIEAFLYFYVFFRREAFTSGWLAKVLAGSEDFAQKLTDKLEDEVYEALELIAQGFLEYRRNRLQPDAATLHAIYEQSLVLLYRLLFIFYAESREILPLNQNDEYTTQRGLSAIKRLVAQMVDFKKTLNRDSGEVFQRLSDLFFFIGSGHEQLDLPPYNGHLFSMTEHAFLVDKAVGDAYLVPALDKLARVDVVENRRAKRVFVDYRDLEVRHLGSIYEKLLEYELDIATEPLTLKNGKYAPAKADETPVKRAGQVYLRTGSNERKITGSYYTPDYIVRFIVEKSIEPLLTDITARHADMDDEGLWHVRDAEALVRDVLALNILDPATGSGHFVVDATSYIAEWLTALALRPADLGEEDELIYWKRQVAGACIYAVDINPLAVELAKLSMWLTTLAQGKPLSFLDHHLRVGNSLVGASIFDISDDLDADHRRKKRQKDAEKAAAVGQMMMFSDADFTEGVRFAVEQMAAIEATIPDTVSDVKQQEALYADLTERLSVWKQAADVWAARQFGLVLADPLGERFGQKEWRDIHSLPFDELPPYVRAVVREARRIADEHQFFHWELAFPEIFFNADGTPQENPGFDAVIGNPPYVRQERIQPIKPYLSMHYEVYSGTADLFLYFYERGLQFLKDTHRLGYITSGTFMNSNSAKPFRAYIHDNAAPEWIANFGENQPFRGAEMVYPTIAILRRGERRDTFHNLFIEGNVRFAELGEALENGEWVDSLSEATSMDEWRFQSAELTRLFRKLVGKRTTLEEHVNGNIYRGVVTGYNEAFIIDVETRDRLIGQHQSSAEIIKPMLRGQDLRPWYRQDSDIFLIVAYQGIDIELYPAIKKYLEQYRTQLEPKPQTWDDAKQGRWLGRASGNYAWYELQTSVAYRDIFDGEKICWPDISKLPRFSLETGSYFNNTAYMIGTSSQALLCVLQSRPVWFALSQLAQPLRLRGGLWQYRLFTQFMERLPIPILTAQQESSLAAIAEEITGLARGRYALHEDFRRTLVSEFDGDEISTRVALYRWWEMADEKALSDEIKRRFGRDIPLNKRAEWRGYLADETAKHADLTAQIITLETRMNDVVYDAFGLDESERRLI
ncbi:MAG: hypothetical protein EA396_14160, partial [Anaerolineaceae bacterium]